jgi:tetratricopeptide (TPR) repeat protein
MSDPAPRPGDRPAVLVTRLAELEHIPAGGGLWGPIRRTMGVTAFGVNAYLGERDGDQVIEEHDELGSGSGHHEELYVVLAGTATFTVGGETIAAPAGTLVFLPDPAVRRGAVAEEAGTRVLVVGGRPGAALPTAPYEHWFAADPACRAGDYERAIEIASAGLVDHAENGGLLYQLACYHALAGHREAAIDHLRRAYAADPRTREWAATDEDLASVRDAVD